MALSYAHVDINERRGKEKWTKNIHIYLTVLVCIIVSFHVDLTKYPSKAT